MTAPVTTMAVASGLATAGFAASIGIGLVFLTAGYEKYRHRTLLPGVIANYRLLPRALVAPASAMLPIVEIAIGVALLAGLSPLSALAAILLLGLFAGAMAINILRGRRDIGCGCGRPELHQSLGWPLVARNLVMMAMLMPQLLPAPPRTMVDVLAAVGGGLGLFLAYTLFHSIGALFAAPLATHRR